MAKLKFRSAHFEPTSSHGGVIFLLTAIKSRHWFYMPVIKRLLKEGFSVYAYDYPARPLLRTEPSRWVEFIEVMTADIKQRIQTELSINPRVRFGIIGVSVGSTLALYTVKQCPEIERMMFVTMYGSSAQLVWENKTLKHIRKKFERANQTAREAFEVFGPLEATKDLDKIGQRPMLLFVSMDDQVISYSNANLFIDAAVSHNLNFKYRVVDVARHSRAIMHILADYPSWLPFIDELLESPHRLAAAKRKHRIGRKLNNHPIIKQTTRV